MDAQMITSLAGIGGTLIAGIGGIFLGAHLQRKAEEQREEVDIRRAARVIDADLLVAVMAVGFAVEKKKWWPAPDVKLTLDGWERHRDVIAPHLPWSDWLAVLVAVRAAGDLQAARDDARSRQLAQMSTDPNTRRFYADAQKLNIEVADATPGISEATVTLLIPMLNDVEAGRTALRSLTRDVSAPRRPAASAPPNVGSLDGSPTET
jgi:hypothetical protein